MSIPMEKNILYSKVVIDGWGAIVGGVATQIGLLLGR